MTYFTFGAVLGVGLFAIAPQRNWCTAVRSTHCDAPPQQRQSLHVLLSIRHVTVLIGDTAIRVRLEELVQGYSDFLEAESLYGDLWRKRVKRLT